VRQEATAAGAAAHRINDRRARLERKSRCQRVARLVVAGVGLHVEDDGLERRRHGRLAQTLAEEAQGRLLRVVLGEQRSHQHQAVTSINVRVFQSHAGCND
jgi:hypothetical protein